MGGGAEKRCHGLFYRAKHRLAYAAYEWVGHGLPHCRRCILRGGPNVKNGAAPPALLGTGRGGGTGVQRAVSTLEVAKKLRPSPWYDSPPFATYLGPWGMRWGG